MKLSLTPVLSLRFLLGLGLAITGALRPAQAQVVEQLNPDQVDQLLGPIALYPDPLIALILPASTNPADLVLAQRYFSNGGDPDKIDDQPWNESVKGLARYPALIQWLDENLAWTRELGSAFLNQPDSVMESVQRLRVRAKANGTLTSTPQQKLLLDGDDIEIVPAQPDVIYVPYYDPNLVYGEPGYYGGPPYVTFGLGLPVGYWLSYDFNWRNRVIIIGDRHHNWAEHHDWNRRPGSNGKPYNGNWRPWTPPANRPPASRPDSHRPFPGVVRPNPFPGAPNYPGHDQRPDRPRTDNNPRDNDHNRPPGPSNNPNWNQGNADNRDRRPPNTPTPRPDNNTPQPNTGPRPSGPSNNPPPTPANNPAWNQNNHGRPPGLPPAGPRPDTNSAPTVNPPRPTAPGPQNPPPPMPNVQYRQPPTRPPEMRQPDVRPGNPAPAPRPAAPPPPPPSKDNPRDDRPEPPR